MSITYTPTTNFGSKDSLPSNDPNKVIRGAEFTTEFTAIQSAFGLAAPASNPTFTGTATFDSVTASTVSLGSVTASSLTVNGAFTSPGIDDNATSTAITINSSGTVDYTNNIAVTGSGKQIIVDDTGTNNVSAYMTASNTIGGFVASRGAPNDSEVRLEAKGNFGSLTMTGVSGLSTEIQSNSSGNLVFNMNGTQKASLSQAGTFTAERLVANGNMKVEGTYPALDLIDTDAPLGLGTRMVTSSDSFLINTLSSAGSYVQDIYKVSMNANGPTLHSWTTESRGTAMALTNGGTLGLGVAAPNPAGLMEIQANSVNGKSGSGLLMLTNSQSNVASITFNTTGNDYSIGSSGVNLFNVYDITNASTPFAIDPNTPSGTLKLSSAGRVGIGTSSPNYKLSVQDNPATTGAPQVVINSGASDVDGVLGFLLAGASKGSIIANKPLTFHTNTATNTANERMRIDNLGNVGIGTGAPARTLHVNSVMRLEPRATAPTGPSAGDIYFDSNTGGDNGVLRCYDGTAWRDCF